MDIPLAAVQAQRASKQLFALPGAVMAIEARYITTLQGATDLDALLSCLASHTSA